MFQYCLPQLRTPPLGSHSRSPSALAGKQHCFFAYCSAHFSVCEVSIVHHRAKQIWTLQSTRSVCVSVCMCTGECVCVSAFSALTCPRNAVIDTTALTQNKLGCNSSLNEYENFKPPLHSLPQFLWSTLTSQPIKT